MARVQTLGLVGLVLTVVGLSTTVFLTVLLPGGVVRVRVRRYIEHLERELRFLRSGRHGAELAMWQVVAGLLVVTVSWLSSPLLLGLEALVLTLPHWHLKRQREARVRRVEQQLDSWLLALANALRAVPSVADALISSQTVIQAPLAEELDVAIKEYRLGTPLDEALQSMGERLQSRVVSTALTTLQVARRTGGDLSVTLETSAAGLREMARLEGVVRSKTAEGRGQAWIVGSLPLGVVLALHVAHPDLMQPLFESSTGHVLVAIAALLWLGAIALARRILHVDV